jgi:hypothetical protein
VRITRRARYGILASGLSLFGCGSSAWADPPPDSAAAQPANSSDLPKSLPQDGFISSLKQAAKQGFDHEIVRGHFDVGTAPNVRRYYCLQDVKTGEKEPNGVFGDPVPLPGGKTGLKNTSISMYTCATAEKRGMLITTGYGVDAAAAAAPAPQDQPPAQATKLAQPPTPAPAPTPAQAPVPAPAPIPLAGPPVTPNQIDIGGVKLGMSPDEVRAVLKSKKLLDYTESAETLSFLDPAKGVTQAVPNGRFVNLIAAWTPPPSAGPADAYRVDGESYEVMFTPVPGREQVMGIVHSLGYSPANAIHEVTLENGLAKKFGGFAESDDLPASPTWRVQSSGNVLVGDPCNRRGTLGGLGALTVANPARENLALKWTPEDFKSQIDHCGLAIVTEDHFVENSGALRADRLVTRFTVTAYSPSIGLEGARGAEQLIRAAGGPARKSDASRAKTLPPSSL